MPILEKVCISLYLGLFGPYWALFDPYQTLFGPIGPYLIPIELQGFSKIAYK